MNRAGWKSGVVARDDVSIASTLVMPAGLLRGRVAKACFG